MGAVYVFGGTGKCLPEELGLVEKNQVWVVIFAPNCV